MFTRFLRFNLVSAMGIAVQVAVLAILASGFQVHYLVATVLAIELAILHNFAWHERWTWRPDRLKGRCPPAHAARARRSVFSRCLAFHAGNGCVSLLGSLVMMPFLVGVLRLHYLLANLAAIAATGLLNFVVSDRLVFGELRAAAVGPAFRLRPDRIPAGRSASADRRCRPSDV